MKEEIKQTVKQTQKQRLLEVLKLGKKVCQIDLNLYLYYKTGDAKYILNKENQIIDSIADLGIANLPARIFDLKKEGYDIKSEKINCKGRFCNTFYYVYYLEVN